MSRSSGDILPGGPTELWRRLRSIDSAEAISLLFAAAALLVVWPIAVAGKGLPLTVGVVVVALVLVGLGVPLVLRTLAVALVVMAIVVSATDGGLRIHLVGPLVFLAVVAASSVERPSFPRLLSILVGVIGVVLVSLLLGGWLLHPRSSDAPRATSTEQPRDSSADGLWQRLLEYLGLDSGESRSGVDSIDPIPPPASPDDSSLIWWIVLLVVAAVLALVALLYWLVRRKTSRRATGPKWSLIARFERVGARAGTPRDPSQGVVSYGEAFSNPADARPTVAGEAISAALFHPAVDDPSHAETLLKDLERDPPTKRKRNDDS